MICPACLRLAWAEELETWLCGLLQPRHIHVIHSSNDMLPDSISELPELRVCIVSYTMARLLFENLRARSWKVAVVDESHSLRRSSSGKASIGTRAILQLLRPLPRLLLLSGTPSRSSYLDIFTQADLLSPGTFGDSWEDFLAHYDEPVLSRAGFLEPGRCRRPWQLALLLTQAVMVRRRKCEVLEELPAKRRPG